MSSKAQQINDAIIALFQAANFADLGPGGVRDDPDYRFEMRDLPFIAVYRGDEQEPVQATISSMDRDLTVIVRVTARQDELNGKSALSACDPLVVATHNKLMANSALGGLAFHIRELGTNHQRDVIEVPVAYIEKGYSVSYTTNTTSLEA